MAKKVVEKKSEKKSDKTPIVPKVEMVLVEDLAQHLHPKNPRQHPDFAIEKLVKSIKEFGWTNPILIDKNGRVLAGHARIAAAQRAGLKEIPVIQLDLEGAKADAYVIADNRLQQDTIWDPTLLHGMLEELKMQDFDLTLTGFEMPEIDKILGPEPEERESFDGDQLPDSSIETLAEKWGTAPGQLWRCGEHVIFCGDASKKLTNALGGAKVDLVVTSPPYNVGVDYDEHKDATLPWAEYKKLLMGVVDACVGSMKDGRGFVWNIGTSVLCHPLKQATMLEEDCGLEFVRQMIWYKHCVTTPQSPPKKTRSFHPIRVYESVYVYSKGQLVSGGPIDLDPMCEFDLFTLQPRDPDDNMPRVTPRERSEQSNIKTAKAHPAAFPVKLPSMFIRTLTDPGEVVLDPFGGSGTTMIACEMLNRKCVSMEISPGYVAVMLERWSMATGGTPKLVVNKKGKGR